MLLEELSMIDEGNPWFGRGGYHSNGVHAGGFSFGALVGNSHEAVTFRLVLAI